MFHHWMHHRTRDRGLYLPRIGAFAHLGEVSLDSLSDVTLTTVLYDLGAHTRDDPYKAKTITLQANLNPTDKHIFIWCDTLRFDFSTPFIGQGLQANGNSGGSITATGQEGRAGGNGGSGGGAGAAKCTGVSCPIQFPTDHAGNGGNNGNDGQDSLGDGTVNGGVGYGQNYSDWTGYLTGGDGGTGGESFDVAGSQVTNGASGASGGRKAGGGGGGGAIYIDNGGNQTGGAGGGSGGGKVIVVARYITNLQTSNQAQFTAKGGNGGNANTFKTDYLSGAGGGGGGGIVMVWAQAFDQAGISGVATGGAGGSGLGNGLYGENGEAGTAGQAKIYSFDECFTITEQNFSTSWDYRC